MGLLAEIVREDGEMARGTDCAAFACKHNIPCITVQDIVDYRLGAETIHQESMSTAGVRLESECIIPVTVEGQHLGEWTLRVYHHNGLSPATVLWKLNECRE